MQEPGSIPDSPRVFLLAFPGAEIYYSTTEACIVSVLVPQPVERSSLSPRSDAVKPERKGAR